MKQLRQLILGGLAILAISASPGLNAATSDCFVPARDGSGIGDLHLLSSDPLEVGALAELKLSRASAFFRDTDLLESPRTWSRAAMKRKCGSPSPARSTTRS